MTPSTIVIFRMPAEVLMGGGTYFFSFLGAVQPIRIILQYFSQLLCLTQQNTNYIGEGQKIYAHQACFNFLSSTVGSISLTALEDSSYYLMAGNYSIIFLIRYNLGNAPQTLLGKSIYIYLISSYTEKSIRVKYPKNQSYPRTNCSYFCNLGSTLFFHWFSLNSSFYYSVPLEQLILIMLPIVSIVQRYIWMMPWSAKFLPNKSIRPHFYIKYSQIGNDSVRIKSSSIMKGKSGKSQFFVFSTLKAFHYCSQKSWSTQAILRYQQSKRGTCALPRMGQYPIVMGLDQIYALFLFIGNTK